jgi:hypothetical protein
VTKYLNHQISATSVKHKVKTVDKYRNRRNINTNDNNNDECINRSRRKNLEFLLEELEVDVEDDNNNDDVDDDEINSHHGNSTNDNSVKINSHLDNEIIIMKAIGTARIKSETILVQLDNDDTHDDDNDDNVNDDCDDKNRKIGIDDVDNNVDKFNRTVMDESSYIINQHHRRNEYHYDKVVDDDGCDIVVDSPVEGNYKYVGIVVDDIYNNNDHSIDMNAVDDHDNEEVPLGREASVMTLIDIKLSDGVVGTIAVKRDSKPMVSMLLQYLYT